MKQDEMAFTLSRIGGKWKPIILWQLIDQGTKRFSDIQRYIPDITHKTLTKQLRELEGHGLITRTVYPQVPPKVEYTITDKGEGLYDILKLMCKWGRENAEENLEHSVCERNL